MNDAADLPLAAEFPPATRAQWRSLVESVLKGRSFEERLVGTTYDRLRIEPLYQRAADAVPIAGRAAGAAWQLVQRVDHPDPAAANAELLHDLQNGATGLSLVFAGAVGGYGYGLPRSRDLLPRLLDQVQLDAGISIDFDLSPQSANAPHELAALAGAHGLSPGAIDIRMNFDPLGALAFGGVSLVTWPVLAERFARMVAELAGRGLRGPFACADGRMIHNAGGSEAQELAFALANALAYLRALEAGGIAADSARHMIAFRLSADSDQFLTLSKFRALRKLWARIEEACGLTPAPAFVAAETAWRMMTRHDPWVNILRTTLAVFAAGLGGADAVTVLPFTAARGLPDRLARRIARNTQLVLLEEANLARVADPAAGSGMVEDITDQLCAAAWALFQEIEGAGGSAAALEQGLIQQFVAATRAERQAAVARRTEPVTGTSTFPHLDEGPMAVLDVEPARAPQSGPGALNAEPLPRSRLAEPFEQLRDAADHLLAASGSRPRVFLATLGQPADFTARATFARDLFAAGGIEAVGNDGFTSAPAALTIAPGAAKTDLTALAVAFEMSGSRLACLCSSDEGYAREAADAARALAAAGAEHIYLAGRPGSAGEALQRAGVKTFLYAGCDALAVLQAIHERLGTTGVGRSERIVR